jgi:hypothetical protein
MVRTPAPKARGWIEIPARRSTTTAGTPCSAKHTAADRPTVPPPAIRTGMGDSGMVGEASVGSARLQLISV